MATARLLDLTRSLRRAGRGATGIDRVELAYLQQFLTLLEPVFGVVRTPLGYLLLDQNGLQGFADRLVGAVPWGSVSLLSRAVQNRGTAVKQAESDLRRLAIARARRGRLPQMLDRALPQRFEYYNVGHSNLTDRMLGAVKRAGGTVHVLVHDVIPLTHPQFQRQGTVQAFRDKIACVTAHADRVIYNSEATRAEANLGDEERPIDSVVAHLGIDVPTPDPERLPSGLPPQGVYFVVVGTIEPRKNHGFLLDLWETFGAHAPPLLICGSRGWNNAEVFNRLDALAPDSPVHELPGLDDAALAALVQKSAGMLFPSVAEGFGLPPVEALSLGARVLCNDLQVLREILGDHAVFASVSEADLWKNVIQSWVQTPHKAQEAERFTGPNWDDHFKTVLRLR